MIVENYDMKVTLKQASINDVGKIHKMQVEAFKPLLEKYKDYETNPGNETIEQIRAKIIQPDSKYYFIYLQNQIVGAIRIVNLEEEKLRISPIFVMTEFQGRGIAQRAINIIENMYPNTTGWKLDTALQETKLCHLYEKIGYKKKDTKTINDKLTIVSYEK